MKGFLKKYGQKVMLACSFSLLFQTVVPMESVTPKPKSRFEMLRQKAAGAVGAVGSLGKGIGGYVSQAMQTATKKAYNTLGSVASKITSFSRQQLFNMIQSNMQEAGNIVRRIVNCAVSGQDCRAIDRAAIIATTSAIFLGLMILSGSAITVAARSKVIEQAKREEAQKVKGWRPARIAQKLNHTISSGRERFISLKDGIISGRLTASQRKFLFALGGTIIGSTLLMVGALTAVAFYAKAKEEPARSPGIPLTPDATPDQPIQPTTPPIATLPKSFEGTGVELNFDVVTPEQMKPKNPVFSFFNNTFKLSLQKAKKLTAAIKNTAEKGKKKFFKNAEAAGEFFLKEIGLGANSIKTAFADNALKDMINNLLGINFTTFFNGLRSIVGRVAETRKLFNVALSQISMDNLKKKMRMIKDVLDKAIDDYIPRLVRYKNENVIQYGLALGWLVSFDKAKRLAQAETDDELEELYKKKDIGEIRYRLVKVLRLYPKVHDLVMNQLDLNKLGEIINSALNASVGAAINTAILTNQLTGKLGKFITSDDMVQNLDNLKTEVANLGARIKEALSKEIFLVKKPSNKETVEAVVNNLMNNKKLALDAYLKNYRPLMASIEKLQPDFEALFEKIQAYNDTAKKALDTIKKAVNNVKKDPLYAIPRFPFILRDNVAIIATETKAKLAEIISDIGDLFDKMNMSEMLANAIECFESFNTLLKIKENGVETSIINPEFLQAVKSLILTSYVNINEIIKTLRGKELSKAEQEWEEVKYFTPQYRK